MEYFKDIIDLRLEYKKDTGKSLPIPPTDFSPEEIREYVSWLEMWTLYALSVLSKQKKKKK